jgi:nitrate/nitrite transporter NarK
MDEKLPLSSRRDQLRALISSTIAFTVCFAFWTIFSTIGMMGGLGGFVLPIAFGAMDDLIGIWTSCFILLLILVAIALTWMHFAILSMEKKLHPEIAKEQFLPELGIVPKKIK